MTRQLRLAPLAVACFTLLAIALALPGGAARAQGSADVGLVQRVQAALANAGFDPGPADGKAGPRTRRAIQAWQRAHGQAVTGKLTRTQLKSLLAKTTPTTGLEPKCAELPGRYLGENHAECWEEVANRPGCFVWDPHYNSDRTTRWTGRCRRGVAEGRGTLSESAGSEQPAAKGTGTLVGGKPSGHWIVEWANGGRYEGEYRDGYWHGRGRYSWKGTGEYTGREGRHEGQWRDGKAHGHGVKVWPDGGRYEGQWRDGKQHGRGTYTWPNGNRYEGEYRDGKAHGRGTYTWADGGRHEGEFRNGDFHGYGTRTWPDGSRYQGQWRDGKRTGYGTYTWASGHRYEGEHRDGKAHGRGTETWSNGNRYDGEFRDGKRTGYGTYTWADGDRYEGEYRDGKAHGYGTYTQANGDRYEGQWRDGCFEDRAGNRASVGTGVTSADCGW